MIFGVLRICRVSSHRDRKKTGEMDTEGIPEAHISLSPHVVDDLLLCG
jgi:hypothetical protein